ncbi:MAG: hypothetical protein WD607_10615 [Candidatus Paceibacterota bacterium]
MEIKSIFEKIYNWEYTEFEFISLAEELLSGHNSKSIALKEDLRKFEFDKRNELIDKIEPEVLEKTLSNIKPFHLKSLLRGHEWIIKKWESEKTFIEYYSPPYQISKALIFFRYSLSEDWIYHIKREIERKHFPYKLFALYKFKAIIENLAPDSKTSFENKKLNLPESQMIAGQYHIEKGSKHKEYSAQQIAPVMEVTQTYIEENPEISTIHGHVKPIIDKCDGLTGGRDAKSNWIKFYAEKAGLKTK